MASSTISPDRWLVPGTPTCALFCQHINDQFLAGELCEEEALALIDKVLSLIVSAARRDLRVPPGDTDDFIQALHLRIATMDAANRYDPSQSSPTTYLRGIARTLIREQLWRRRRPEPIAGDALDRMGREGTQLDRAARDELLDELRHWLDQLSPGELRAIVYTYGPVQDCSAPIGPRRRLRNPEALPRALDILRQLAAHQNRQ